MDGELEFWRYGGGWGAPATRDSYQPSESGGGRRGRDANAKLAEQIIDGLNRLDINHAAVAGALAYAPTGIQQNLFDIVLLWLGSLANRDGQYPGHQMETTYAQARKMLEAITMHR